MVIRKALVVDDDESVAAGIAAILETRGIASRVIHRGNETIAAVDEYAPDVVILDVGLPDADGRDLCAMIVATSKIPVLLVSGHVTRPPNISPRVAFLAKPFEVDELCETIEHLDAHRT